MKKLLLIIFIFVIVFLPKLSFAGENIANFNIVFEINSDTSVDVIEEILYDFEDLQRHGIYRDIPIKYQARGGNFELRLSDISVTDENGRSYDFSKTISGGNVSIKIGDANKFVTGQKVYIIKYKIKRALNYFDNHDEFYWNAIGNDWKIPLNNISAKVILPRSDKDIQKDCFVGYFGTQEKCSSVEKNSKEIIFTSRNLLPGEGITLVVGFSKGIVSQPSATVSLIEVLKDNWIAFLPIIVLVFMFNLWKTKGRDPVGRKTIVVQYDSPDKLTPLEIGTLLDEKAENKDVSSQIIELAVKGYIKIKKIEAKVLLFKTTDYEFEKLKNQNNLINEFDREIIVGIFGASGEVGKKVKMSKLKNKFYISLKKILDQTYKSLVDNDYFPKNPKKTKAKYFTTGIVIVIAGVTFGTILGGIGVFALISSGIIIMAFSFIMPVKTKKGVLAHEHILGLKEYLTVAEKDRLKFHNAPEKNPKHFEELLPYAMALGVAKEWGEQFKGIYKGKPDWYSDSTGGNFSSMSLVNGLSNFSSSANAAVSSTPSSASSGGSGFSGGGGGGGFGGGGGGSW
jgi:uncharacterized membrane protein